MEETNRVAAALGGSKLLRSGTADVLRIRQRTRRKKLLRAMIAFALLVGFLAYRGLTHNPIRLPGMPSNADIWGPSMVIVLLFAVVLLVPMLVTSRSPHLLIRPEHIEVGLDELKGLDPQVDEVTRTLNVFMGYVTFREVLGGNPRRGILFEGPPGTGKTTVGRALAHRLKSKFFLVDGTFIAGTAGFYQAIAQVFEAARQNAPSIVFIDDTDVIFEDNEEYGLYRYLLTMLDGLESESAGRVCVIMTAMDVGSLPPALVRSGRIELWLETRLPDEEARMTILRDLLEKMAGPVGAADAAQLAMQSEGLTGADLKRVVEDGKALFAYDKVRGLNLRPAEEYFLAAIGTVRANKSCYEAAVKRARERRKETVAT